MDSDSVTSSQLEMLSVESKAVPVIILRTIHE